MLFEERIEDAKYINLLEGDERTIVKRSLRWMFYVGIMVGFTIVAVAWAVLLLVGMVL